MKRDHVLFLVIGVLVGFLAGYVLQEYMAARQPQRLLPGQARVEAGAGSPGSDVAPPAAGSGGMGSQRVQELVARVAQNPEDAQAVLELANLNFDIKNWSRAVQLYEQFLKLRPDNPDVISDMGICYRELGEFQKALDLFDRAQEIQPDHWQSRFNEVVVQAFDLKDYAAAEKVLDELRSLQPDNPNLEQLAQEIERRRNAA